MRQLLRFADFLVTTSVFTASCALGLCMATEQLLGVPLLGWWHPLHFLIFGGTLCIYNIPRLFRTSYGKPRGPQPLRPWYWFFLMVGAVLVIMSLASLPWVITLSSALLGLLSLSYFTPALPFSRRRLRDYGMVKILVLTAVWTGTTAVLPIVYYHLPVARYPFELIMRFVLVFALCILFDIRDITIDRANNISTLPHRVGSQAAYRLVYISIVVFIVLAVSQYVRFPMHGRLLAALLTAAATTWVTAWVRNHLAHRAFVAVTDGMMLLYAVLVLLLD